MTIPLLLEPLKNLPSTQHITTSPHRVSSTFSSPKFSPDVKKQKPKQIMKHFMTKTYEVLMNPTVSVILMVVIFASFSSQAFAASGGVMGGRSFSSSPSHSFPSSSSSYRSSSYRSYSSHKRSYYSSHHDHLYYSSPYGRQSRSYTATTSVGTESDKKGSDDVILTYFLYMGVAFALCLVIFVIFESNRKSVNSQNGAPKTSIVKLQVSLPGMARSFQKDLNRIAEQADTSTQKGIRNILTESALSLIRHSHYWSSSDLYVTEEGSVEQGEKVFSELSFEERSKFDQETLVNLENNVRKQEIENQNSDDSKSGHEHMVVTFLVATSGILTLPSIYSPSDLKTVLMKLTSLSEKEILAVEVMWTPQEENDTLSSQRVLQDYPLLKPL